MVKQRESTSCPLASKDIQQPSPTSSPTMARFPPFLSFFATWARPKHWSCHCSEGWFLYSGLVCLVSAISGDLAVPCVACRLLCSRLCSPRGVNPLYMHALFHSRMLDHLNPELVTLVVPIHSALWFALPRNTHSTVSLSIPQCYVCHAT